MERVYALYPLVRFYILTMMIRTENCPRFQNVYCWIPPKTSSNQSPAIALQRPSVDLPSYDKADLAPLLPYFQSEYSSSVETVSSDPLTRLLASSGQLTPPVDIFAPLNQNFQGGVQPSGDDSTGLNLFFDTTV